MMPVPAATEVYDYDDRLTAAMIKIIFCNNGDDKGVLGVLERRRDES
jgi:hypothetical protein